MARRLSNVEWVTFLQEVDVPALDLPPWGGVVGWRGMDILVYIAPSGEVYTTDVTGEAITQNIPREYNQYSEYWWYQLPEELLRTVVEDAIEVGQITKASVDEASRIVGEVAGNVTAPILGNLSPLLIVLGIVGIIYLAHK